MRRIIVEKDGYLNAYLVRDIDSEKMAEEIGIPINPPDLCVILDNAKKELHNELVNRGLFNFDDVQKAQSGITEAILTVLRRKVIEAYRSKDRVQGGS
jgi:hypothetical protein